MTRFARGGNANKKKPQEASSWGELQTDSTQDKKKEAGDCKTPLGTDKKHKEKNAQSDKLDMKKSGVTKHKQKKKLKKFEQEESPALLESKKECKKELSKYVKKQREQEKRRVKRKQLRDQDKVCYNCRKSGHHIANCPSVQKDPEQGTGICFKCGSTEHASSRCHVKVPPGEYPYAKCFICGEMGHLSKQCPDNPRGLYPKGGCCKHCGSVEHFRRDCPELQKEQGIQDIKLDTINSKESADAEDDPIEKYIPVKKKKAKVVNF